MLCALRTCARWLLQICTHLESMRTTSGSLLGGLETAAEAVMLLGNNVAVALWADWARLLLFCCCCCSAVKIRGVVVVAANPGCAFSGWF